MSSSACRAPLDTTTCERSGPAKDVLAHCYHAGVTEPVDEQVKRLRCMLEEELDRQAPIQHGCWPLIVGLVGVALGIWLLASLL